jgi:dethiobiotin synthetase
MTCRRLIVVATGTGVGKTHVGCVLLRCLRICGLRVLGLKPIESGVDTGARTDQQRLAEAAGFHVKQVLEPPEGQGGVFHVKPSPYWFAPPVAPHLAARQVGQRLDLAVVRAWVQQAEERLRPEIVVVETAGGLFSPLGHGATNLDLAVALAPAAILLVAPDRLGVLHDVTATAGLATARGRRLDAVLLSEPETPDPSTGRNAGELKSCGIADVLAVFPWAPETSPAAEREGFRIAAWIDPALRPPPGPGPT